MNSPPDGGGWEGVRGVPVNQSLAKLIPAPSNPQ